VIVFDPRAGLGLRPVTVQLAGHRYQVRAAPAEVWLEVWAMQGVGRVLPGMLTDPVDRYRYYSDLSTGRMRPASALEASRLLWGQAAGCDWWVADNLALQAVNWTGVGGELYAQGLRPASVPLGVWLASAYRVLMASVKPDERPVVEGSLAMPPDGYDTGELPSSIDQFIT
jgi:hypothetical protein